MINLWIKINRQYKFGDDHLSSVKSNFYAEPKLANRKYQNENEHKFRNKFERDRDRILYSKEFRRLSGKTQVFVSGFDDHARTRLTHTLEVSQIARTIARALDVNEILTEAIAYGHDLGHTPFGHTGERTLNHILNGCHGIKDFNINLDNNYRGFKHNWQGLRVVTELERINDDYKGLNLTDYTRWGILHHTKLKYKNKCDFYFGDSSSDKNLCSLQHKVEDLCNNNQNRKVDFYNRYDNFYDESFTIEALIVAKADEIAQRHHDLEDGLEAGIIDKEELLELIQNNFSDLFKEKENNLLDEIEKEQRKDYYLSMISKLIVNFLTRSFIRNSKRQLKILEQKYKINNYRDFNKSKSSILENENIEKEIKVLSYPDRIEEADGKLQDFLYQKIINSHIAQSMDGKANYIIRQLIKAYLSNPQQLPDSTVVKIYENYNDLGNLKMRCLESDFNKENEDIIFKCRQKLKDDHFLKNDSDYRAILLRTVCDYIAGMTDDYAYKQFDLLYGTTRI